MTPFFVSFLLTALFTPAVIALAWRRGWVAKPREDRWHSRPTALMGGSAMFLGTAVAVWATGHLPALAPLAFPAAAIFLLGVVDDRLVELRPYQKLIGQVAVAAVLIAGGVRFAALPLLLALPLTLLWVVGITNAVNLLDNMDGLAAGVTGISALTLAACCLNEAGARAAGTPHTAAAALAVAGACAGFLLYNFNPAKIFMGDCGSMFLGFTLAALAIADRTAMPNPPWRGLVLSLLVPVTALAIPIFDTTLVAVARALHGRPIFPGFRDHSSHRMVALGVSERATVLVFYALALLFGGLALAATRLPALGVLLLALTLFAGLTVLGLYLGLYKVYPEECAAPTPLRGVPPPPTPPHRLLLRARLLPKKQLLQVMLDVVLILVSFVGAHLLRFDGELPPTFAAGVQRALPFVLVSKLLGLAFCRAYRGVWRYAGTTDGLRAAVGSTVGSLLIVIFGLFTHFHGLSRTALIVDWVLFTALAVLARTGYVVLQHLFGALPLHSAPRVLILGAGRETMALLQKLRDPLSPFRAQVVGILDDDPDKQRRTLNGVPVLGTLAELPAMSEANGIACCLLGVPARSAAGERILEFCQQAAVQVWTDLEAEPTGGRSAAGRPLAPLPPGALDPERDAGRPQDAPVPPRRARAA
jgi:UDP-GlcNAc:undecaprenyl-phosphate GlcNAc-1-phosphate transferase